MHPAAYSPCLCILGKPHQSVVHHSRYKLLLPLVHQLSKLQTSVSIFCKHGLKPFLQRPLLPLCLLLQLPYCLCVLCLQLTLLPLCLLSESLCTTSDGLKSPVADVAHELLLHMCCVPSDQQLYCSTQPIRNNAAGRGSMPEAVSTEMKLNQYAALRGACDDTQRSVTSSDCLSSHRTTASSQYFSSQNSLQSIFQHNYQNSAAWLYCTCCSPLQPLKVLVENDLTQHTSDTQDVDTAEHS